MKNFLDLRMLVIFSIIVPAAIYIGYLLSDPYSTKGVGLIILTFGLLLSPLLLKDHHVLPFIFWNSTMYCWFLPGSPPFWLLFSALSVGLAFLTGSLRRRNDFMPVPSVSRPLIFLAIVVVITAKLTGGIGGEALGSATSGGYNYMLVFGAFIGFFALSSHQIPLARARWYIAAFFLIGSVAILSDLILLLGPSFFFLYAFINPDTAVFLSEGELGFGQHLVRAAGAAAAGLAVCHYLLARFGIRQMLGLRRWWVSVVFFVAFIMTLLGGFRSHFIILSLLVAFQFFFEKLFRSGVFPAALLGVLLLSAMALPFVDRMPLSIQRSLSFLPVRVDPEVEIDADASSSWRIEMWKSVLPDVPKYLWLGKGFAVNSTDRYLTEEGVKRGLFAPYESFVVSGSYHNGPLTTIIPFGVWGAAGFLWFAWASIRYLHRKKEHGHPALRTINTFLLSLFCSSLLFFLTIYGQLNLDLCIFTGIIGFAIALNRGAENPKLSPQPARARAEFQPAAPALELVPASRLRA